MIVVDSSVWIDFLNGRDTAHTRRLRQSVAVETIVVGDVVMCEVLQGLRNDQEAARVESLLRRCQVVPMVGAELAVATARHFRVLRRLGITVRKTIDMLIGTWCIEHGLPLLHNDADFRPMARHLGLIEVAVGG